MKAHPEKERVGYSLVDQVLRDMPLADPPPGLTESIMAQVRQTPQAISQSVRWRAVILAVLLASGLSVVGLLGAWTWLRSWATPENLIQTQLELWYWSQRLQNEWLAIQMRALEQPAIAERAPLLISVLAFSAAAVLLLVGLGAAVGGFATPEQSSRAGKGAF